MIFLKIPHIPRPNCVKESDKLSQIWPGKTDKEKKQAQQITQQQQQPATEPQEQQTPSIYQPSTQERARLQFTKILEQKEDVSETIVPPEAELSSSSTQQQQVHEEPIEEIFTEGYKDLLLSEEELSLKRAVEKAFDKALEPTVRNIKEVTTMVVEHLEGQTETLGRIDDLQKQHIQQLGEIGDLQRQHIQQLDQQIQQSQEQIQQSQEQMESADRSITTAKAILAKLQKGSRGKRKDDNDDESTSGNQKT